MGCIKFDILENQLSTKKTLTSKESDFFTRSTYLFGFNGMEKDPEITGEQGSHYTAPFWEYDTRIARRWNVDPAYKKHPHQSDYSTFNGNPIWYADPSGLWGEKKHDKANKERDKMADKLGPGRVGDVYNLNEGTDKDENWGFNIYKEKGDDEVQSYIFSNDQVKDFKKYHLGEKSKIAEGLEKADDFSKEYVAPTVVKVLPPTSMVDGAKTLCTGVDINGTEQKGAWSRVISPLISVSAPVVGVLNVAEVINIATKTANAVDAVDDSNTVLSATQEVIRRVTDNKKSKNEKSD